MKVRCDICFETIAEADLEVLTLPLNGAMFGSPDGYHGFPAPFDSTLDWESIRCPYSPPPGHRPFISPDEITVLQDGQWVKVKVPCKEREVVPYESFEVIKEIFPTKEEVTLKPAAKEPDIRAKENSLAPRRRGRPKKSVLITILED